MIFLLKLQVEDKLFVIEHRMRYTLGYTSVGLLTSVSTVLSKLLVSAKTSSSREKLCGLNHMSGKNMRHIV